MRLDWITRALDGLPGLRRDGSDYLVPEEIDLSIFISLPAEVLTVARIARLVVSAEILIVDTHKRERFCFALDSVAGLKSQTSERAAGNRSAGFRKEHETSRRTIVVGE